MHTLLVLQLPQQRLLVALLRQDEELLLLGALLQHQRFEHRHHHAQLSPHLPGQRWQLRKLQYLHSFHLAPALLVELTQLLERP
jgi:hypothetical protein